MNVLFARRTVELNLSADSCYRGRYVGPTWSRTENRYHLHWTQETWCHIIDDSPILIAIRWKFNFTLIQLLTMIVTLFDPKSLVPQKNARFDLKMLYPACIRRHCRYQTPLLIEMTFQNLIQTFCFKEPIHELNEINTVETVQQWTLVASSESYNSLNKNFSIWVNNNTASLSVIST